MRVLLTDSSGFLGSHVAEQLRAQDHEVRLLVRTAADPAKSTVRGDRG